MKKKIFAILITTVLATGLLPPQTALAETHTLTDGMTLNFSTGQETLPDGRIWPVTIAQGDQIIIAEGANATLKGSAPLGVKVSCNKNVHLTLDSVNIDCSETSTACALSFGNKGSLIMDSNSTLTLVGESVLKSGENMPGVRVENWDEDLFSNTVRLEIKGDGSLQAFGGQYAAGIGAGNGGPPGEIVITGGTIYAKGGGEGAGIGGGSESFLARPIRITGGQVTAVGGDYFGAGIGGGFRNKIKKISAISPNATIIISGGTIDARGGKGGAGIGTGDTNMSGPDWEIVISGGTVTAQGNDGGAGIGGGDYSITGNITLSGGTIFAHGSGAPDVGNGANPQTPGVLQMKNEPLVFLMNDSHIGCTTEPGLKIVDLEYKKATGGKLYGITLPEGWPGAGFLGAACKMVYDDNGGTGSKTKTLPKNTYEVLDDGTGMSKDGYSFTGWNTSPDGTGTSYAAGETLFLDDDALVLYAMWGERSVTKVTLSSAGEILAPGSSVAITAEVEPEDAKDKGLTWTSSDEGVATVNQKGVVTAVAVDVGSATVKATAADGVYGECRIEVVQLILSYSLESGDTMPMTAILATDASAEWESSATGIAAVDDNGAVTAVSPGTALITARANGVFQTCGVIVFEPTKVSLNATTADMIPGDTLQLLADVTGGGGQAGGIIWTSSNTAVAKVSQNGEVSAAGRGYCTITARTGGAFDVCTVGVYASKEDMDGDDVTATIITEDLPKEAAAVRLPDGRLIPLKREEEIRIVIDPSHISDEGLLTLTVLDKDGNPIGVVNASVRIHAVEEETDPDGFFSVPVWALAGTGAAAAALLFYIAWRRRAKSTRRRRL